MNEQNYSNHTRFVTGYHIVVFLLLFFLIIFSAIHLAGVVGDQGWIYSGLVPLLTIVTLALVAYYTRVFPLKVQDRAIRAEENLRYFILTGKRLDPKLTIQQIIALRFAPDDEFPQLVSKTLENDLSPNNIKKSIVKWKADDHRA